MIKIGRPAADEPWVSTDDPYPVHPSGPPLNQFGTPQQFGSPQPFDAAEGFAPSTFGTAAVTGTAWSTSVPSKRGLSGASIAVLALVCAVLVGGGVAARHYVFPDLSKPLALPAVVAGVPQGAAGPNGVTMQTKDRDGHAVAVAVYADQPAHPNTLVMVTAGRSSTLSEQKLQGATTVGKVTCTMESDVGALLNGAAAQGQSLPTANLTGSAVCWRTSRHLSVLAIVLTADGTANQTAVRAVSDAWDAI